jgi:hypothetical protein
VTAGQAADLRVPVHGHDRVLVGASENAQGNKVAAQHRFGREIGAVLRAGHQSIVPSTRARPQPINTVRIVGRRAADDREDIDSREPAKQTS